MVKYRIDELMKKYKDGEKKTPEYRKIYNNILKRTGMDSTRFWRVRNMKLNTPGTIPSDQLIEIAEVLEVTVDELLNRQKVAV